MRIHTTMAVLAAVSILGMTACGDDDVSTDRPTDDSTGHSTGQSTDETVLAIEMSDFAFEGLPASVPAGTRLAVENSSSVELHELVALRISDTEERSVEELMALPEAELRAVTGPMPAAVLVAAPGGPQIAAVGDGTLTEPGRYLLLCGIPTGADPAAYLEAAAATAGPPEVAGGPPHFVHGMFAELLVE